MECFRQLRIIREQNNLTQQHIADALGISRSAYCGYEIGRRSPDIDTIVALAKFYKLPIERFFEYFSATVVNDDGCFEMEEDTRFLSQLSKDEVDLIAKYRIMNDMDKKDIITLAHNKIEHKD